MRLIDADLLAAKWKPLSEHDCLTGYVTEACLIELNAQPTVDAVPVVHGEWVEVPYKHFDPPDYPFSDNIDDETGWTFEWDTKTTCSVCGYEKNFASNYCPNCGAKMDGGSE